MQQVLYMPRPYLCHGTYYTLSRPEKTKYQEIKGKERKMAGNQPLGHTMPLDRHGRDLALKHVAVGDEACLAGRRYCCGADTAQGGHRLAT